MPFYVRLGLRGIAFRIGTFLVDRLGSVVYWRAKRRRGKLFARLLATPHLRRKRSRAAGPEKSA